MNERASGSRLARNAMAYVLAGGRGSRLMELTDRRAKPAVYFGGKTRIIDFALSQRAQLGHPPVRRGDPVQGPFADPPPAARLELLPAGAQRELRHPAGQPARLRDPVVRRHRRRGLPEHRHHRFVRPARAHGHPGRRPRLQDGLRADAGAARRRGRRRDRGLPRGAAHGGRRPSASCMSTSRTGSSRSSRSPRTRRAFPAAPELALASMGIYVFRTDFLFDQLRRDASTNGSARDFGKDIIPYIVQHGKAVAHRFTRSCVRSDREQSPTGATSARSMPTGRPMSTSPTSCPSSTSTTRTGRSGPIPRSRRRPSSSTTRTAGVAWR